MKTKTVIVSFIILWTSLLYSEIRTSTFLFDIPTANVNKGFFYEFTFAGTFTSSDDPFPVDTDLHFMLSLFNRLEMSLSYLTIRDFNISPSLKFNLIREKENVPCISIGVLNLWTARYISSVGRGKYIIWEDDSTYIGPYRRTSERNSFYIVFTKDFGPWGRYNIGFGRGAFVGYGPRSRQFNTDRIYNWERTHNDAVGIFWGMDIEIIDNMRGGFEFDGRDFNIGFNFKRSGFEVRLLAAKIEHRLGGWEELSPRIDLSATFNSELLRRPPLLPRIGAVAGSVVDRETNAALKSVITVKDVDIAPVLTDEYGKYTLTLEQGSYIIRASAEGYYWVERKVYVREGLRTLCDFRLRKKQNIDQER